MYTFFCYLFKLISLLVCLSTLITIPIADIKTKSDVEPALINGKGKPVGGMEPPNVRAVLYISELKKSRFIAPL